MAHDALLHLNFAAAHHRAVQPHNDIWFAEKAPQPHISIVMLIFIIIIIMIPISVVIEEPTAIEEQQAYHLQMQPPDSLREASMMVGCLA